MNRNFQEPVSPATPALAAGLSRLHGGNRTALAAEANCPATELLDFSASINPLGPPEWLRPRIACALGDVVHYPEPRAATLCAAIAARWSLPADCVLAGNGANELIYAACRAHAARPERRAVIAGPAYIDYERGARAAGLPLEWIAPAWRANAPPELDLRALAQRVRPDDLVMLGSPANPAGTLLEAAAVARLCAEHRGTVFLIDEAFMDFVEADTHPQHSCLPLLSEHANLLVLRSFTKFYAIPGLRLGCLAGDPALLDAIHDTLPDWNVNSLAQAMGPELLADESYAAATREFVAAVRGEFTDSLDRLPGLRAYSGHANFILCKLTEEAEVDAPTLAATLLKNHGIAIRNCANIRGLDARFFRVAVRSAQENERLCAALAGCLAAPAAPAPVPRTRPRRAKSLMIQGTASNAGKSVLTAAFCRILLQDGLSVAPFKSQNMSLNSFVTADGREMARAQAVQAAACRLDPEIRMSPVLLKPSSGRGSQVLVHGRPVGHMTAMNYQKFKPEAFEAVKESYDSLAAEYDAIVLEGAGSPGEVNLKRGEIVNMRMAAYADAPVLLAGDIDRGGVFAGFVGTMEVLTEAERARVHGFLVNRFRGDAALLDDAFEYMLRHTGRPVLGVIPFLPALELPEEDSVNFKDGGGLPFWIEQAGSETGVDGVAGQVLDIALIDLPHISNFTDFDPLALESDVSLRIVRRPEDLGTPDAVILPGTKSTVTDLARLRSNGMAAAITRLAHGETAVEIVGICGGFQMLGTQIHDAGAIESDSGNQASGVTGLGLLPLETSFAPEKTLRRMRCRHSASGLTLNGYEIHHGRSLATGGESLFEALAEYEADQSGLIGLGLPSAEGRGPRIWGAYLHGLFDNDMWRRWFLDALRSRRGWGPHSQPACYSLEPALERLAAAVRESVDLSAIYRSMGL